MVLHLASSTLSAQEKVNQTSAGSEDRITNAQTMVLEAADKVTSGKTLPTSTAEQAYQLLVISCEFVIWAPGEIDST